MAGEPVRIGPFIGGLNNVSDPAAIADNELADIVNLEVDFEGALKSRPPITSVATTGANARILGYYVLGDVPYLIVSWNGTTRYYDGTSFVEIATFAARCMVQYDNKAWLFPAEGSGNTGGQWSPSLGFSTVASMPEASSATVHKERVWASNNTNSRVRFCNIANPVVWGVNDYFDVNNGDGQNIVQIRAFSNGIYIWKNDSTYTFQYSVAPTEGAVQAISTSIGASGEHCVVEYENYLYVYHEGRVYELVNYNYGEITTKIQFINSGTVTTNFMFPISMTRFRDRIVLRYFDQIYVFQLKTRTWSRWESSRPFGPLFQSPQFNTVSEVDTAYAVSWLSTGTSLYRIRDRFDTTNTETFTCYIQTKTFDFGENHSFKRLFWWGVDILASSTVRGRVTPVVYSSQYTWDDLDQVTWDQLDLGTWDQLLEPAVEVQTEVSAVGTSNRKFLKFLKSLRFRQVRFEVWAETDGTTGTGPISFFGITSIISPKEKVSKQVS